MKEKQGVPRVLLGAITDRKRPKNLAAYVIRPTIKSFRPTFAHALIYGVLPSHRSGDAL